MKKIKLDSMDIDNFKGITGRFIDFNGESKVVSGDNETGKTTIADAFMWSLFNKNSLNQTKFNIRPLDENGEILDTETTSQVNIILNIAEDGSEKEMEFEKEYITSYEYNGYKKIPKSNKIEYRVNEKDVKKKEYDEEISNIVTENLFMLLTSPRYFNNFIDWKERRNYLLELVPEIKIEDVKENLSPAAIDFFDKNEHGDYDEKLAELNSKLKKAKKRADEIPARIKELEKQKVYQDLSYESLEEALKESEKREKELDEKILKERSDGGEADNQKKIQELKNEKFEIERNHKVSVAKEVEQLTERKNEILKHVSEIEREIFNMQRDRDVMQARAGETEEKLQELRDKYRETNNTNVEPDEHCPTCKQELPQENIEEIRQEHNIEKSERLEKLKKEGTELSEQLKTAKQESEGAGNKIPELEKSKNEYEEKAKVIEREIENAKSVEIEQRYHDNDSEIKKLESENPVKDETQLLNLQESAREERQKTENIKSDMKMEQSITETKNEEKTAIQEYQNIKRDISFMNEYIIARAMKIEEYVNQKFDLVSFKMFEHSLNGEIKETCKSMYKGVEYGNGLNTANEIKAGLEIMGVLQEHYGVKLPVFLDNAEAVNDLPEIDTQVIELRVSQERPLVIQ